MKDALPLLIVLSLIWCLPDAADAADAADSAAATGPLTLERLLTQVEQRHETPAIARQRVARSRAARREALAALLPQVSVSAMGRRNNQEVLLGDRVVRQLYAWDAGARAAMVLFDGSRYPLLGQAEARMEIARLEQVWAIASLRQEATVAFFAVAAAQREVAIAQQTLGLRRAWLERVAARAKAGLALSLDVDRARVQRLQAEQMVLEASARAGDAADMLAGLLGEPTGRIPAIVAPPTVPAPPTEGPALLAAGRADLRAGELAITATQKGADSTWWRALPRLEVVTDAALGPESFSSPDGFQWSISLIANWQVWDGGARSAQLAAGHAEVREQRLALQRATRLAGMELRNALRAWRARFAALQVARQSRQLAEGVHDQVAARFERGLATSFEVSEAADGRDRSRLEQNRAALAVQIAAIRHVFLSGVAKGLAPAS